MRVTLVKPNMGLLAGGERYVDTGRMEPLQLGVMAGITPSSINLRLVDDRCEDVPYAAPTDLAAITVETFTARRAYEIADTYRERGVPVVLGGFHPTLCPEESAAHADAIVVGDAESVWHEVLDDAAGGRLKSRYSARDAHPAVQRSLPRRDLFEGKRYLPISLVQFGRGCCNGCEYCAVTACSKRRHRCRPVSDVVKEVQSQNRRMLFFVDDNIVADRAAAKELFRALIPLRIKWVSQGTVDMVEDSELMDLMKRSGCLGHVIGFESLDRRNLEAAGKPAPSADPSRYDDQIAVLKSYGLQTWAAFTLGYDHDTPESLSAMLEFALRHKFTFAAWNVLVPYPGTPFLNRLASEDRLLYKGKWWLHPEYRFNHAAFVPALMTPDELTATALRIRKRWNSTAAVARRFLDVRTNLRSFGAAAIFWSYNRLFRRETFKKQGMSFGYSHNA